MRLDTRGSLLSASHDEISALRHVAYVAREFLYKAADRTTLRAALDRLDQIRNKESRVAFVRAKKNGQPLPSRDELWDEQNGRAAAALRRDAEHRARGGSA